MCYHWLTHRSDSLHYLVLHLPAWPYSGLVGKATPPPVVLHLPSGTDGFCPLGLIFYKVYFKHLGLLAKTWGNCSIFEGYPFWSSLSKNIWWRFRSCRRTFSQWQFPRKLLRFSFWPIFLVVSALVARLIFYSALVWQVSLVSCLS